MTSYCIPILIFRITLCAVLTVNSLADHNILTKLLVISVREESLIL